MATFTVYPPRKNSLQGENYYPAYYSQNKEFFNLLGVDFQAFTVVKGAEKFLIYGMTKLKKPSFSIKKDGGAEQVNKDLPILFAFRHTTGKGRNGDLEEPNAADKKLCELLESNQIYNNGSVKYWSGKLYYDEDADALETVTIESLKQLDSAEIPPIPEDAASKGASGGNNFNNNYSKKQGEKEKLDERIAVLLSQMPKTFKTLSEVFSYLPEATDEDAAVIKMILEYFPKLICND